MSSKIENLRAIDENTILISAEFYYSYEKKKTSEPKSRLYTLDFIVEKHITLNQLLDAIDHGLYKYLEKNNVKGWWHDKHISKSALAKLFKLRSPDGSDDSLRPRRVLRVVPMQFRGTIERVSSREKKVSKRYKVEAPPRKKTPYISIVRENSFNPKAKTRIGCIAGSIYESSLDYEDRVFSYAASVFAGCLKQFRRPELRHDTNYVIGLSDIDFDKESLKGTNSVTGENQIWLEMKHEDITLDGLGFVTSSRIIFDATNRHEGMPLFDREYIAPAFKNQAPRYNISDSPNKALDETPVRIIPPSEPPQKSKDSPLSTLLSPLLMSGAMIIVMPAFGGGGNMIWLRVGMGLAMFAVAVVMYFMRKREQKTEYRKAVEKWKSDYELYIGRILKKINEKQVWSKEQLDAIHLDKTELMDKVLRMKGGIFSRRQNHRDFLSVRLGVSMEGSRLTPSPFAIVGETRETVFASARYKGDVLGGSFEIYLPKDEKKDGRLPYLNDLPANIAANYAFLANAPVLLDLQQSRCLGVVPFREQLKIKHLFFEHFLDNFIFELCSHHSPDHLQCVMFSQNIKNWDSRERIVSRYKHLPHFRELLDGISPFAFDKKGAHMLLNRLNEIMQERQKESSENKQPHIVVFFRDDRFLSIDKDDYKAEQDEEDEDDEDDMQFDDLLKQHPFSEFLPDEGENPNVSMGLSFVFCKEYKETLPKYCGQVIEIKKNNAEWRVLPHERVLEESSHENQYSLLPDDWFPPSAELNHSKGHRKLSVAFKMLSVLHYYRVSQGANFPLSVNLFDLHLGKKIDADYIEQLRSESDVTKSLKVPIGKPSGGEKDEIVSLDLHENAEGCHMVVAGTTGSGKSETVLTYLISLCMHFSPEHVNILLVDMKGGGFSKDLEGLPHVVGAVTEIDEDVDNDGGKYALNRFLLSIKAEVRERKKKLRNADTNNIDDYIKKANKGEIPYAERLPHLFVVIDEFAELMRFSSEGGIDYRSEIDSLCRVGRSIGIHVILVSQNIEGAISDEIRHNINTKLCLKVKTPDASRSMIGNDAAASPRMPGKGRTYMYANNGSAFEYFQAGFSQARMVADSKPNVQVVLMNKTGEYDFDFYNSHIDDRQECKKAVMDQNQQTQLDHAKGIIQSFGEKAPRQIFRNPLVSDVEAFVWDGYRERG